ncbi:MAG: hypothetical protein ACYTDX_07485, partial [Planctomycetota bacterium]
MSRPRPVPSMRGAVGHGRFGLPEGTGFTVFTILLLAGIETAARVTRTDVQDGMLFMTLFLLAWLVKQRHGREPLPWVGPLVQAVRDFGAWAKRETVELGVDLRGAPAVRAGFPPFFAVFIGVLAVGAVTLALLPSLDPASMKAALRPWAATLWVLLTGASWALFLVGGFYLAFMAGALVHDEFVRGWTGHGRRPRGRELVAVFSLPMLLLASMALLPPWLP